MLIILRGGGAGAAHALIECRQRARQDRVFTFLTAGGLS
jgi:hypothetical protein